MRCVRNVRDAGKARGYQDEKSWHGPGIHAKHSMWQHVAPDNLRDCQNPVHRFHWVPAVQDIPLDPDYSYLAGKYLQKTFARFDGEVGVTPEIESAFDVLGKGFARILYVSFEQPQGATDSELDENGILTRYRGDQLVGVTILNARKRFGSRA